MSPIRPVKSPLTARKHVITGADVLPPWKRGDYPEPTAAAAEVQWEESAAKVEVRLGPTVNDVFKCWMS